MDGLIDLARHAGEFILNTYGVCLADSDVTAKIYFQSGNGCRMKILLRTSLSIMCVALFATTLVAVAAPTADEIMKNNFLTSKVMDSTSDAIFHLMNAAGQERIRETRGQTKLIPGTTDNMRIVEFLSPSDIRGTK